MKDIRKKADGKGKKWRILCGVFCALLIMGFLGYFVNAKRALKEAEKKTKDTITSYINGETIPVSKLESEVFMIGDYKRAEGKFFRLIEKVDSGSEDTCDSEEREDILRILQENASLGITGFKYINADFYQMQLLYAQTTKDEEYLALLSSSSVRVTDILELELDVFYPASEFMAAMEEHYEDYTEEELADRAGKFVGILQPKQRIP